MEGWELAIYSVKHAYNVYAFGILQYSKVSI